MTEDEVRDTIGEAGNVACGAMREYLADRGIEMASALMIVRAGIMPMSHNIIAGTGYDNLEGVVDTLMDETRVGMEALGRHFAFIEMPSPETAPGN